MRRSCSTAKNVCSFFRNCFFFISGSLWIVSWDFSDFPSLLRFFVAFLLVFFDRFGWCVPLKSIETLYVMLGYSNKRKIVWLVQNLALIVFFFVLHRHFQALKISVLLRTSHVFLGNGAFGIIRKLDSSLMMNNVFWRRRAWELVVTLYQRGSWFLWWRIKNFY